MPVESIESVSYTHLDVYKRQVRVLTTTEDFAQRPVQQAQGISMHPRVMGKVKSRFVGDALFSSEVKGKQVE